MTITQIGSTLASNESGAVYQWIDCDNGNATIVGEVNQTFVATVNGSYAVIVDNGICVDTSACILIDLTDINEIQKEQKVLLKIVDLLGRETEFKPNIPLIFIYSDGSKERVMKLEE